MDSESGLTRSIIDQLQSSDIQGDQMEGGSGVSRGMIDELFLRISNDIKWKLKVVVLEVSLMNFILGISNEIKGKLKVVLLEV